MKKLIITLALLVLAVSAHAQQQSCQQVKEGRTTVTKCPDGESELAFCLDHYHKQPDFLKHPPALFTGSQFDMDCLGFLALHRDTPADVKARAQAAMGVKRAAEIRPTYFCKATKTLTNGLSLFMDVMIMPEGAAVTVTSGDTEPGYWLGIKQGTENLLWQNILPPIVIQGKQMPGVFLLHFANEASLQAGRLAGTVVPPQARLFIFPASESRVFAREMGLTGNYTSISLTLNIPRPPDNVEVDERDIIGVCHVSGHEREEGAQ